MKKKTSKLISMLLAAVMVLSMAMTGLAAEIEPMASSATTKGSITISNAEKGETYSIYQIFELTYSDNGDGKTPATDVSYSYKVVNAWKSFIEGYTYTDSTGKTAYLFSLDGNGYLEIDSNVFSEQDNSDVMAAFAKAALAYAETEEIEETKKITATGDTVKFTELNLGYYLVDTTLGSLCFLDSTNPDASITEKNGVPSITKTERDVTFNEEDWHTGGEGSGETSANGDKMEYRLIVANIHDAESLVIHDYLDSQLVDTSVNIQSVTIIDGTTSITLTEGENGYTYSTIPTCGESHAGMDGCSFEITINSSTLQGLSSKAYLEIIYQVTISEDSSLFGEDLEDEIDNTANVTFGAAGEGTPSEVETFSFGFNVYKYTGDIESEENTALADASFVLKQTIEDDKEMLVTQYAKLTETSEGSTVFMLDSWVNDIADATVITTDTTGKFTIEGLHDGTYYLEETAAPDGYNKLTGDVTVVISPTGTVTVDEVVASDKTANIENNAGSLLPGTGGMGTTLFYIVGIVLILGAAVLFVTKKRLDKE